MKIELWAAGRLDGVAHQWDEFGNSLCGTLWTEDFSDETDAGRCSTCERIVTRRNAVVTDLRKRLGAMWPISVSASSAARVAHTSPHIARDALEAIYATGDVFVVEDRSGRRRYSARRALVKAAGRTYGMNG